MFRTREFIFRKMVVYTLGFERCRRYKKLKIKILIQKSCSWSVYIG